MIINEKYNIDSECVIKEKVLQLYIWYVVNPIDEQNNNYYHILLPYENVSSNVDEFNGDKEIWYLDDSSKGNKIWYFIPKDAKYKFLYTCREFYNIMKEFEIECNKRRLMDR